MPAESRWFGAGYPALWSSPEAALEGGPLEGSVFSDCSSTITQLIFWPLTLPKSASRVSARMLSVLLLALPGNFSTLLSLQGPGRTYPSEPLPQLPVQKLLFSYSVQDST